MTLHSNEQVRADLVVGPRFLLGHSQIVVAETILTDLDGVLTGAQNGPSKIPTGEKRLRTSVDAGPARRSRSLPCVSDATSERRGHGDRPLPDTNHGRLADGNGCWEKGNGRTHARQL